MAHDWSQAEVELIVSDYLEMLASELRGEPYSKTEHRRRISGLLNHRSDGSIERKHQNISAILIELGLPYVDGYKPLRNYQQRLFEAVRSRLLGNRPILDLVEESVTRPVKGPEISDILSRMEDPPSARLVESERVADSPRRISAPLAMIGRDYLAEESRNRSLGNAGEEFAVRYERARLIHAGRENLADRVEQVSITQGDHLGFDVRYYEVGGLDRLIEVKTTGYGKEVPFYLTRNELRVSREHRDEYHLYRIFRFRSDPKLFSLKGALDDVCLLDPIQYQARAR